MPASERPRYIETISRSLQRVEDVSAMLLEVGNLINWGAEQSNFHPQQAMRCWYAAQVGGCMMHLSTLFCGLFDTCI